MFDDFDLFETCEEYYNDLDLDSFLLWLLQISDEET